MKVEHIYEIPATAGMSGGDLYDKFGNLEYFADVTALNDKTFGGVDTQYIRAATRATSSCVTRHQPTCLRPW